MIAKIAPKGIFWTSSNFTKNELDYVKQFGEVWNRQKVMDNTVILEILVS